MEENQNIEFKESWRDEYLRQICGLANTHGGTMLISIDDNGKAVGVNNAKKLQEDIPNKVRDTLGILPEVLCHQENGKDVLEVVVQENATPVSYINVETWGRGIQEMCKECTDYGCPMPYYREQPNGIMLVLQAHPDTISLQDNLQDNLQVTLNYVLNNPECTYNDIAIALQIHRNTAKYRIGKLKELGLIRREGSDKNGHWVIYKFKHN